MAKKRSKSGVIGRKSGVDKSPANKTAGSKGSMYKPKGKPNG